MDVAPIKGKFVTARRDMTSPPLIDIPVIDIASGEEPALATFAAERGRLDLLLKSAARTYTRLGLVLADRLTKSWARKLRSPYADSVRELDRQMDQPGAHLLNYSYEWGCTTGAFDDAISGGTTMLRTLDWPFDGLGCALIVARQQGTAGPYLVVTWPGFAGVLTAMAPGRFAAAINQPPLPFPHLGKAAGWLANRLLAGRSRAIPPDHLLRLAFDTCGSFDEAVALVRDTPICLPAIITIAGANPGQHIVIERTPGSAFLPDLPVAANHWAATGTPKGKPRNPSSRERRLAMTTVLGGTPDWSLGWVREPVIQPDTRLVAMANPHTGRLVVQGWEKAGPATTILDLSEG
jgi:hypothetical protein